MMVTSLLAVTLEIEGWLGLPSSRAWLSSFLSILGLS